MVVSCAISKGARELQEVAWTCCGRAGWRWGAGAVEFELAEVVQVAVLGGGGSRCGVEVCRQKPSSELPEPATATFSSTTFPLWGFVEQPPFHP